MLTKTTLLLVTLAAAGCSATPPASDPSGTPEAAIRGAKEVGAEDVPSASLYLEFSEQQAARAAKLKAEGNEEEAAHATMQAKADAELALALTRQADAIVAANAAKTQLQTVRAEN